MAKEQVMSTSERAKRLQSAVELGQGRISPETVERAHAVLERTASRGELSVDHTVIGFFGATGSGKSSLFNAVVGQKIARSAATRPTTSEALAAIWGSADSAALLDWLHVNQRVYMDHSDSAVNSAQVAAGGMWNRVKGLVGKEAHRTETGGLILLDLPDFDSIEKSNRELVERMVGLVDVLVWVFDPQKYADAVIHREFIAPLAQHGGVMLAVLNQADRVEASELPGILDSLTRQLAVDGLGEHMLADPLAVSALQGDGIDELRSILGRVASQKLASRARIEADLSQLGKALRAQDGGGASAEITVATVDGLDRSLFDASGAGSVIAAAGKSYALRAASNTGWVPTRWLLRFRADPLKRLNLHHDSAQQELSKSSLPELSGVQKSAVSASVRSFSQQVTQHVGEPWKTAITDRARENIEQLPKSLERAIAAVDFRWDAKRWWWPLISVLQWLGFAAALTGLMWLLSYTVAGFFQIILPPAPQLEGLPLSVPAALVLVGILLGILLAGISRGVTGLGKKSYEKKMKQQVLENISSVTDQLVVQPTQTEVQRYADYNSLLEDV